MVRYFEDGNGITVVSFRKSSSVLFSVIDLFHCEFYL